MLPSRSDMFSMHVKPRRQELTCGHSCGCGDGRNDLASNELGFELVHFRDLVVACTHVGQARNEVHVEVGVHVFLKHYRSQLEAFGQLLLSSLQVTSAAFTPHPQALLLSCQQ